VNTPILLTLRKIVIANHPFSKREKQILKKALLKDVQIKTARNNIA